MRSEDSADSRILSGGFIVLSHAKVFRIVCAPMEVSPMLLPALLKARYACSRDSGAGEERMP